VIETTTEGIDTLIEEIETIIDMKVVEIVIEEMRSKKYILIYACFILTTIFHNSRQSSRYDRYDRHNRDGNRYELEQEERESGTRHNSHRDNENRYRGDRNDRFKDLDR
jgi:hypothetical protein